MNLYVMDTDIVGFAFQRHSRVMQRIQSLPEDDLIVTTIITLDFERIPNLLFEDWTQ
jgi:hypothetical protein